MAGFKTQPSTAESLRKTRTYGKVRCHNPSCLERIQPEPGAERVKCPRCGMEYRLYWVNPKFPRIRGPVWDTNRKLAEEKIKERELQNSKKSDEKEGK